MASDEQSVFVFKGQTAEETKYLMHLPAHGHRSWDTFATGYRRAAEVLSEHVLAYADDVDLLNTMGLPLIFLWRHYLELRLKDIIVSGSQRYSTHCLVDNWQTIIGMLKHVHGGVSVLRDVSPDASDVYKFYKLKLDDYDKIKRIISEFDYYDKDSETFRYPEIRKKGLVDATHIDLKNLSGAMPKLADLLDEISQYLSIHYDLEREYAGEY